MASTVEYAMMIGLMSTVMLSGVKPLGEKLREQFKRVGDAIGPQSNLRNYNEGSPPPGAGMNLNIAT